MTQKKPRNPDHVRRRNVPGPDNEVIEAQLTELLTPAIYRQMDYYRQLGLRSRILTLPLMVAAVLTLMWRQVPSVHELTRLLAREDLLWCQAVKVTQQSLSERFLVFPAELFERVLKDILPLLVERWQQRQKRPVPVAINLAQHPFDQIWAVDGSTLEALFRKLKALKEVAPGQLAGKICTVLDLSSRLPVEVWFTQRASASDTTFIPELLAFVPAKTLLILDRGFYDFNFFANLVKQQAAFITRLKDKTKIKVVTVLTSTDTVKDLIVILGTGQKGSPQITVRLVEIRFGPVWYRYITSVLDPTLLPPFVVADLYRRRWRLEEAFNTVKRLLNLAYLWTGSLNGIQLQIWATWLFYAILVDLGDAVADDVGLPFDRISLEMLYRGLYHFTTAYHKGLATDPVTYFTAPENQDLAVVKRLRKPPPRLDLSPYPV